MPATATKPAPKAAGSPVMNPLALKGKPKEEVLEVKKVVAARELQGRLDIDTGSTVDEARAQQFADAMKAGDDDKFPPIKCVRLTSGPAKGQTWVFDGLHTLRGKELAKIATVRALVWDGSPMEALSAEATVANREHEKSGKPLSNKDKIHSVAMLAKAFTKSDIPKKDWPSNRALADMVGCSRQLVNEIDPFDRTGGDTREETAAKKAAARKTGAAAVQSGKDHVEGTTHIDPVTRTPCNYEVVRKATKETAGRYHADSEEKALDRYVLEHAGAQRREYVAVEIKGSPTAGKPAPKPGGTPPPSANGQLTPPKNGSPVGFDWAKMDESLGYLVRGVDAAGDLFSLKSHMEQKGAAAACSALASYLTWARKQAQQSKK